MDAHVFRKLVMCEGPSAGNTFPLEVDSVVIGREPGVEVQIESPGVSRRHARVYLEKDACYIEDLGSSNGTFVNDQRLTAPLRLSTGDKIRLGKSVCLEFQGGEPPASATMLEFEPVATGSTMIEAQPLPTSAMSTGATMIGEEPILSAPIPPQLVVSIASEPQRTYSLTRQQITIGRADDNDIVIESRLVSRHHATLERVGQGYQISAEAQVTNPLLVEGRPLEEPRLLKHGDIIRVGSLDPGMMVTIKYISQAQAAESAANQIRFGEKTLVTIGRDPGNEVVIDSPTVSRFHAQIERVGTRHRLIDLRSANGTFVNDQRVEKEVWLQPSDVIRVGRQRFVMGADQLDQIDETTGLRVDAVDLNKWVKKNLNILQNVSLTFLPREFICVVGQSGGGKSTLVDAIAGYRPATHGTVLVNGTDVYKNFDAIRNDIGYVPQKDIIHTELTVYQALDYAAKLRMPRDTSKADRDARIIQVLKDLDLLHRKDQQISKLSGGQIKRVSIGVELLTQPGLFFLDEPTSGLDPGNETAFMHLMRRLADQGRTIVMVTHATKNVMLADKVVFLARGGYLAWFGPPEDALKYFDSFRTERERRTREMEFDQIYAILDDPERGNAAEWAKRFSEHAAFQKYVVEPLKKTQMLPKAGERGKTAAAKAQPRQKPVLRASALYQFLVLSARNIKILVRDRTGLVLMMLTPVLVACLDLLLAPLMGKAPFDFVSGDAANGAITLFLMTVYALVVGGLSMMREFVKETDIFKRERLVNLKIFPYVISKIWVAVLLALYQGAAYTIVHFIAFDMPGGIAEFGMTYVTMALLSFAAMMSGLLASALAGSASSAPMLMIMLIIPQIVLSGALAPVPQNVSAIASTRWAFESLIGIAGVGSDVKADACWELPDDLREEMSTEDKENFGCRCMGVAIFKPGSCNFPGLGQYYEPEVDMTAPVEPAALDNKPIEPVIPPAPDSPADPNDQVSMVQYLNALKSYQDEVKLIQDQYRSAMALYEAQAEMYTAQMKEYQTTVLEYEGGRQTAIDSAEGVIESVSNEFGWGFVNKHDEAGFRRWLLETWAAQLVVAAVYFLIILFTIKRKDG